MVVVVCGRSDPSRDHNDVAWDGLPWVVVVIVVSMRKTSLYTDPELGTSTSHSSDFLGVAWYRLILGACWSKRPAHLERRAVVCREFYRLASDRRFKKEDVLIYWSRTGPNTHHSSHFCNKMLDVVLYLERFDWIARSCNSELYCGVQGRHARLSCT
jgi:hypothetical protein